MPRPKTAFRKNERCPGGRTRKMNAGDAREPFDRLRDRPSAECRRAEGNPDSRNARRRLKMRI